MRIAQVLSQVFNPLSVIALMLLLAIVQEPLQQKQAAFWLGIGWMFGVVLPLFFVGRLKYRGLVDTWFISRRDLRLRPLIWAAASCWAGVCVLWLLDAPAMFLAIMICYGVQLVLLLGLTGHTKVSLHAAGVWGGFVMLMFLYENKAWMALPLPALVMWARLVMAAHTVRQVMLGSGAGLIVTWLVLYWILGVNT